MHLLEAFWVIAMMSSARLSAGTSKHNAKAAEHKTFIFMKHILLSIQGAAFLKETAA